MQCETLGRLTKFQCTDTIYALKRDGYMIYQSTYSCKTMFLSTLKLQRCTFQVVLKHLEYKKAKILSMTCSVKILDVLTSNLPSFFTVHSMELAYSKR